MFSSKMIGATFTVMTMFTNLFVPAIPVTVEPKAPFILNDEEYSVIDTTEKGVYLYGTDESEIPKHIQQAIDDAHITNDMSELKKCNKIAQHLANILEYDSSITKFEEELYPQFTDWSILNGKAVCAGYADAFQYMCTCLGIECYYETGYTYKSDGSVGEYHAWNRVKVENEEYWYDVCWYDSTKETTYLQCYKRWNDRTLKEEWFRDRINGRMYEAPTSE